MSEEIRHNENKEREVKCRMCGQWVAVRTRPDDTRWRYGLHTAFSIYICGATGELVPTKGDAS
jgi:DNA-directed RNA polymerase subunit RPC12/RpoP